MKIRQIGCFAVTILSFLFVLEKVEVLADTYEYDALNRVTKVVYDDGSYTTYVYDANGNIETQEFHEKKDEAAPEEDDQGAGKEDSTGNSSDAGANNAGGSNAGGGENADDSVGGGEMTPEEMQNGQAETPKVHKTGMQAVSKHATYTIMSVEKRTATFQSLTNKKKTSYTVPNDVEIDGIKYKVTQIAPKAFKNNKKLKKITIGKNITSIGKQAFYGAKNLKKITIKTTKLKSVGKNALKGIHKKATIKVPKKKYKAYKKLLKGKGQKKSVKIKK